MIFHENKVCRIICHFPITAARESLLAKRETGSRRGGGVGKWFLKQPSGNSQTPPGI